MSEYYPYEEIRFHYDNLRPLIFEYGNKNPKRWVSPYGKIDWIKLFTPIEYDTWQVIRSYGRLPLYPQYPIGNYFLDFGNPVLRIGLECDGKQYHLDKDKDNYRDEKLLNEGWTIFRVTGSECYQTCTEYPYRNNKAIHEKAKILSEFYQGMEGLIKALSAFYTNSFDF